MLHADIVHRGLQTDLPVFEKYHLIQDRFNIRYQMGGS